MSISFSLFNNIVKKWFKSLIILGLNFSINKTYEGHKLSARDTKRKMVLTNLETYIGIYYKNEGKLPEKLDGLFYCNISNHINGKAIKGYYFTYLYEKIYKISFSLSTCIKSKN